MTRFRAHPVFYFKILAKVFLPLYIWSFENFVNLCRKLYENVMLFMATCELLAIIIAIG